MTQFKVVLDSPAAIRSHLRYGIEPEGFNTVGVRFVLCDPENVVRAHFHMTEIPVNADDVDCAEKVTLFARTLADGFSGAAILLALTRPGPPTLTQSDRRWFRAAHKVCALHEVRLLGVHVVTPRGQREVVLDDAL